MPSEKWAEFELQLGRALARMELDQYLVITVRDSGKFVQFAAMGEEGLRAEVTGNSFLDGADRISDSQIGRLFRAGWEPPIEASEDFPNFFMNLSVPIDPCAIAKSAVHVLDDILRVPDPSVLQYSAFCRDGDAFVLEDLKIDRTSNDRDHAMSRLRDFLREATGIGDLDCDEDGDFSVQSGQVTCFISLSPDASEVRLISPLQADASEDSALHTRLIDLNAGVRDVRTFVGDEAIWACSDCSFSALTGEVMTERLARFCEVANVWQERLRASLSIPDLNSTSRFDASRH